MIRSQVWVPKPTGFITQAPNASNPALEKGKEPMEAPAGTYLSWADEVEAADLARDKPAADESVMSQLTSEDLAVTEPIMREPVTMDS